LTQRRVGESVPNLSPAVLPSLKPQGMTRGRNLVDFQQFNVPWDTEAALRKVAETIVSA